MNLIILIFLIFIHESSGDSQVDEKLVKKSVDDDSGFPKETQMAQCTVSSGDIKASAQAAFSRKLEGDFCLKKDMAQLTDNLLDIEARLMREIYNLRNLILNNGGNNNFVPPQRNFYDRPSQNDYRSHYRPPNSYETPQRTENFYEDQKRSDNQNLVKSLQSNEISSTTQQPTTETTSTTTLTTTTTENVIQLKSFDSPRRKIVPEVTTTAAPPQLNINEYTYYWKLVNFPKAFMHAKRNEIFSDSFSIKGLKLRIRAALNFEENENLILDTEQLANIVNGDKMEIEIGDGLVFKEIVDEKLFQFNFRVIDQNNPNHDLISPLYWNTENEGFLVPNSVHVLSNYLKADSLLIKLTITF